MMHDYLSRIIYIHVKILGAAGAISPVPAGLRVRD